MEGLARKDDLAMGEEVRRETVRRDETSDFAMMMWEWGDVRDEGEIARQRPGWSYKKYRKGDINDNPRRGTSDLAVVIATAVPRQPRE